VGKVKIKRWETGEPLQKSHWSGARSIGLEDAEGAKFMCKIHGEERGWGVRAVRGGRSS